jgi:hypothetical protein
VTDETTQPQAQTPPPTSPKPVHPLTQALAHNLHAMLVGAFTIMSSIISALLGYYFGHEDQKRLLALEYDKLRAEHTLEITRALIGAETALQELSLVGQDAATRYCDIANRLGTLKADIGKQKPLPPVPGTLNDILSALDPLIQSSGASDAARADLTMRLRAIKSEHDELDKRIMASWKADDDVRKTLNGETAAMIRVYYRDRSNEFAQLGMQYDKVAIDARQLVLDNGLCNLDPKWKAMRDRIVEWGAQSFLFTGSLGLELKPE